MAHRRPRPAYATAVLLGLAGGVCTFPLAWPLVERAWYAFGLDLGIAYPVFLVLYFLGWAVLALAGYLAARGVAPAFRRLRRRDG